MTRPVWEFARGIRAEYIGFIPSFLSLADPAPAATQFDLAYAHGGGWRPMPGWRLNPDTREAQYPGDPVLRAIAWTRLRHERIMVFPHAWVAIIQPNDKFEISHMD